MDIVENITFAIPPISAQLNEFVESAKNTGAKGKALIIEVAAIHEGATANYNYYSNNALSESVDSWTTPYKKPILRNHDTNTEPLGRVIKARMDTAEDGTPFMKLQVLISDPAAIEKIGDQRYLTGSVGASAKKVNCSVCEADWSNVSMFTKAPCAHERGKEYDGKTACMKVDNLNWKEYSFVNVPADGRSQVMGTVSESELEEFKVVSSKFYSLDLDKESVFELTESENVDILANLTRKEANSIYEGLKDDFLSTLQVNLLEETNVEELETEEDILDAISSVQDGASDEDNSIDTDTEIDVDAENADTEDEGSEELDGETPDIEDAPADAEDEDSDEDEVASDSEESDSEDDGEKDEIPTETELNGKLLTLESRVEELETQNAALAEKNAQLKKALKKILAEQVVDTRISMGLADGESRTEMVEEYVGRSAQSLADSLKDLYSMTNAPVDKIVKIRPTSFAVTQTGEPVIGEDEGDEQTTINPEDLFVQVLMGRKEL